MEALHDMENNKGIITRSFKAAFPCTIPILAGFLFLGMAYGIYMNVSGFSFVYPMIMAAVIFGGSLEFLAAQMLLSPFAPLQVLMVSLMIQARHLFYGISMLDKFKDMGWKKFYLIYGMCDETFSINCTAEIPEDCDRGWFYFFVTLLNQLYWVGGATLGGLLGNLITFVMTAMFIVIFLEQWLKEKRHFSEWAGLASSAACLLIFGKDNFMIPTMICILLLLTAFRKPVGRKAGEEK